jgi:hypothetical protein
MKIDFYRAGGERKALVNAIGEILGVKPEYKGAPTFIYQIGGFEVDKEGALIFDEGTEGEKAAMLLDSLKSRGFTFEKPENATLENTDDGDLLVIEMPKEGFNDIVLTNLKKLLESKGDLIKKALGVEELPAGILTVSHTKGAARIPIHMDGSDIIHTGDSTLCTRLELGIWIVHLQQYDSCSGSINASKLL